ncbi:sensor histidine kinase [Demequina sp. NBRC 110056]|uniref:sensor histidine kinase n=1 Tax=Demequina sp. NBRC 110056 TaxID=1570345 RepID=UPI000A00D367|nr:ATP-binding protein [Demequina sp. NBRC 110056]
MSTLSVESARDRLQRALYTASGIGAVVFGALLLTGSSGILAQRASLEPWYWWASVVVALLMPMSLLLMAPFGALRAATATARIAVIGFLTLQVLWMPGMSVEQLPTGTTPWIQGVTALCCTLAGITWRSRWVWLAPVLQGPLVAGVQIAASDTAVIDAVLDGVGAVLFCSILAAIAQAVLKAGEAQDDAARRAREAAMAAASTATRERELARINAIVHDDIMSVLLAADRASDDPTVPERATEALDVIRSLTAPDAARRDYAPDELAAVLRSTATDVREEVVVNAAATGSGEIPAAVAAAVAEALSEALRNVERHAGAEARVTVDAQLTPDRVRVVVADDGRGFDPRQVGQTRLGIRTSIVGKLASVDGGRADVDSAPGAGTRVTLSWSAP